MIFRADHVPVPQDVPGGADVDPERAIHHVVFLLDGLRMLRAGMGNESSPTIQKRMEACSGWLKTTGGLRKSRFVGREKLDFHFVLGADAYNRVRMRNLGVVAW